MAILLQRTADESSDRFAADKTLFNRRNGDGFFRQIEDLEKLPVKSDQVPADKLVPGFDILIERKLKQRTDGIIGVIGDAVAVGSQDKEKVEKK